MGPKVSKGRAESPLVASAEAKPSVKREEVRKVFPLPSTRNLFFCATHLLQGPEGFQRAIGKPFGRLRRGEILCETGKSKEGLSSAFHKKPSFCEKPYSLQEAGPEGFQRAIGKPFGRLRRGESSCETEKESKLLSIALHKKSVSCGRFRPPAGGRGTFPHGKVPKGCRGRPKGACLMAAPGPPVAKQQCTASLAGARPARFTSVPGRATVAFGAADPSPGSMAPVYPWSVGKGPPRQDCRAAESPPGRRNLAPKKIIF